MKAKTNWHGLLSLVLCFVLCLTLMPTAAMAVDEPPDITGINVSGDTLSWNAFDGAAYYTISDSAMSFSFTVRNETSWNLRNIFNIYGRSSGDYAVFLRAYDSSNTIISAKTSAGTYHYTGKLTGIAVTTAPNKTKYNAGDAFDSAGMVVTATYEDDSTAVISPTVTDDSVLTAGQTTVTVSYSEMWNGSPITKTAMQSITVTDAYNLWIGSTQVTKANKNDILGDGTASYDSDTATLTLSNPTISGSHKYEYNPASSVSALIFSDGIDLKIVASSGLNLVDNDAGNNLYGVYAKNGSLTVTGNVTGKTDCSVL